MPGIASDRSPGIQIGPIASIADNVPTAPGVADLQDAFRQGFITTEDIQNRFQQNRLRDDNLKTQLQAGDFQRKLAPGAFENAQAAQGLQAQQIQAAGKILPGATDITLAGQTSALDDARHQVAANSEDEATRMAEEEFQATLQYEKVYGHLAPNSLKVPAANPEPIKPFEVWFESEHGKKLDKAVKEFGFGEDPRTAKEKTDENLKNFTSRFPLNSVEDNIERAKSYNLAQQRNAATPDLEQRRGEFAFQQRTAKLNDPAVRKEYRNYEKSAQKQEDVLKPGTPEYTAEIQRRVLWAQDLAAVKSAKVASLKDVFKAQAEAPGKAIEAQSKAQSDVLLELHKSEALKRFEPQFEAFEKVDAIRNNGRAPTNADDIAVMYEFVKLLDPTSAVREGEAKLAQSTNPFVTQLYNKGQALFVTKDKILGPDARADMFKTMDTLREGAIKTIAPEIKRVSNIAIDRGVPLDQVFTGPYQAILSRSGSPSGSTSAEVQPPPPGRTRFEGQKGKKFLWNGAVYEELR